MIRSGGRGDRSTDRRCQILRGELAEVSLVDIIQVICNDRGTSQLTVRNGDHEASLFFERGAVVHAQLGSLEGRAALYEMLKWSEGTFELERNVPAPVQTMSGGSAELLLSAMEHIDAESAGSEPRGDGYQTQTLDLSDEALRREMSEFEESLRRELETSGVDLYEDREEQTIVHRLRRVPGVEGAVLVARDGTVLAHDLEGNAEQEGAVVVFVGNTAVEIGETLTLGALERGVVEVGGSRTLVIEQPSYFVGLLLTERTSPELLLAEARKLLR